MKKYLSVLLLVLGLLPFAACAEAHAVAMETLDIGALGTGRPAVVQLWFPQGRCANESSRFCLADGAVSHKAVVISHGAMGSSADYAWLGERLAAAGYVVVGVNHFGESRIYGAHTQDIRSSTLLWQRPQDVSALLDRLASERLFQVPVDWRRVIAIGHSAGGQTASMLAGATFDLVAFGDYCRSDAARADRSCRYGSDRAQAPEAFVERFNGEYQDARIRKLVLIDPALGAATRVQSLQRIRMPTLVVGAAHNDFLPWAHHGQRYAAAIPDARTILLDGQEGHFVFLSECTHATRVIDVPLCVDRAGVDRRAVHDALARDVIDFVRLDDEPAHVAQRSVRRNVSTAGALGDILLYTPRWVFFLLIGLCVFGLMQARTRRVSIGVALILPVAMLVLSLSGVARYAGLNWAAYVCWLGGVAAVTAFGLEISKRPIAHHDLATRRLTIQGSWVPLLVILGIFFTRYALGVASAMQLALARTWYFPLAASLLLGAWSGYFVARGIMFWRATRA